MSNPFLNGSSKKKRISMSKKHIRRNIWKKKGYLTTVKAFSLAKSVSTGHSKSFFVRQKNNSLGIIGINVARRNKIFFKMNDSH